MSFFIRRSKEEQGGARRSKEEQGGYRIVDIVDIVRRSGRLGSECSAECGCGVGRCEGRSERRGVGIDCTSNLQLNGWLLGGGKYLSWVVRRSHHQSTAFLLAFVSNRYEYLGRSMYLSS
jgi:hypothetical protein